MSIPISSLPPHLQIEALRQMKPREGIAAQTVAPAKPRIRQQQGDGMNKWERQYLAHLKLMQWAHIYREPSLPLANGLRYKLDFLVVSTFGRVEGHEVKGQARAAGIAKLKMAASLYPWIKFHLVTRKAGQWQIQEILS